MKAPASYFSSNNNDFVSYVLASLLLGALVYFIARRFFRFKGRLPPGPIGLPFFGVAPYLNKLNSQKQITEWSEKYGNVMSMYLGPSLVVVLGDIDAIKAAYLDQAEIFSGRAQNFIFRFANRGYHGIVLSEGPFWKEQRRFILRSFHELGVGKSRFEQLCIEESQCLVEAMLGANNSSSSGFSPRFETSTSVANIICALVFGRRFDRKDATLRQFLDNQHITTEFFGQAGILQTLPFLRHLPPFRRKWARFAQVVQYVRNVVIEPELRRTEKEYDPQQEPQCVTEFFVQRRAKEFGTDAAALKAAEQDQFVNVINIITNLQNLFGAGTETSITTLTWSILFFLHYPDIQQRCYQEIVDKVGTDRPVSWDDRTQLPYVEAFIHEVWRRANVVPLGVARRTLEDTHLNGYFIPKHTTVLPNMWQVHRDARNWREPLAFKPERFLEPDSGRMSRTLTNIPFGNGKRQCAGEGIARMEIFLFLSNLLQKLEFQFAPSEKSATLPAIDDIITGITVQPARPFNVRVVKRATTTS